MEKVRIKKFNKKFRKRRVYVEHVIGFFKTYRIIGGIYGIFRHPRKQLPRLVELCAALAQRRAKICKDL